MIQTTLLHYNFDQQCHYEQLFLTRERQIVDESEMTSQNLFQISCMHYQQKRRSNNCPRRASELRDPFNMFTKVFTNCVHQFLINRFFQYQFVWPCGSSQITIHTYCYEGALLLLLTVTVIHHFNVLIFENSWWKKIVESSSIASTISITVKQFGSCMI